MQKPDWHCIGALEAHNVEIDGLTCIVRSRTWSIQMKDSTGFLYDDLRVIGGNPGNANQDGMDWLGGGDTMVRNAFLRASDDVFAHAGQLGRLQRGGHGAARARRRRTFSSKTASSRPASQISCAPGGRRRSSTRATSRCATPTFCTAASARAARRLACSASGARTAPGATTRNYTFENLFLDNWYSLVQMEQEQPGAARIYLPQHLGARSAAAGGLHDHGRRGGRDLRQREVRADARRRRRGYCRWWFRQRRAAAEVCARAAGRWPRLHVDPPVYCAAARVTFTAQTVARRALHVALRRWNRGHGPPRAPSLSRRDGNRAGWQRTARADSAFCCM